MSQKSNRILSTYEVYVIMTGGGWGEPPGIDENIYLDKAEAEALAKERQEQFPSLYFHVSTLDDYLSELRYF